MTLRIFIAAAMAASLVASTANATDFCYGNGQVIDIAGQTYVTVDCAMTPECLFHGAIYVETNSKPGLQRGGTDVLGLESDVCQDSENPDRFVSWY